MSEYGYAPIQLVEQGQNIILNDIIACPKGYVVHRNGSGILILRGIVNNPYGCFARYQCTFNGNIAVPETGAVDAISIALTQDGEPIQTSKAIVTPAAVDEYFNVTSTAIFTVPRECCFTIAVENTSAAEAINVQNANLTVTRVA